MEAKTKKNKRARFDARLPEEQKVFFERAARLGGFRSLTDFVIVAAQEKANQIVKENDSILASKRDQEIFFDAILNPDKPNKELRSAAKRYKEATS